MKEFVLKYLGLIYNLLSGCGLLFFLQIFSQSFAESRGKAQAASLRHLNTSMQVKKLENGKEISISILDLKKGDRVVCSTGDFIPADGEVVEGIATVDESAMTGESAPVIRESGGDRSAVTAGTKVISDRIIIEVTAEPGHSFLDKIINLVEHAKRNKTPNEIALNILLSTLTVIFLGVVISLQFFSQYSMRYPYSDQQYAVTLPILIALLVCLIPTTISALLNAIGIAGMDRLLQRNVVAKSGHAVEAAGDVDLLILDKTGTITLGNRMAIAFLPIETSEEKELAKLSQYASLSDETPEGRSIVILAKDKFSLRSEDLDKTRSRFIPFSARTCMSGIDLLDAEGQIQQSIRKGSVEAISKYIESIGGFVPPALKNLVTPISQKGGTPLAVCEGNRIVGVIYLKDVIKGGIQEKLKKLRLMGIKTVMVTGDNPLTAAAIAAEAGVQDFLANATPELKLERIKQEQLNGHLVAMAGDGTNDAPALAQADVGVAMNTGTQASREAGNMVDLDSNPTKLIDIVEVGKQLLMTRGALTTFSIANDVAKYFAILPAMLGALYVESNQNIGPLAELNLMRLTSPQSAILSAVIFNALIIIFLLPLSLRGVRYQAQTAQSLLKKNVAVYGLGGLLAPFIGIKLIDLALVFFGWVT